MNDLRREFIRKSFHMMTLAYWGAFVLLGWPRVVFWMGVCLLIVTGVEAARLRIPAVERKLVFFERMIRDSERHHYSGAFYTTAGSFIAMLIANGDGMIVGTAIGQLAFGDAAAALVGKIFGHRNIRGSNKSLEGSLGCFAVCYALAIWVGVRPGAALACALAATIVERLPTSGFFNDNLWMPIASALTLRALGAR